MDKTKNKERIFIFTTLGIFIAMAIFKMIFHEPWRDEAQAWLLAKNLSIPELLGNMKYEGHPILWHLLLKVLQLFNLPYTSQFILHGILNITAVYLILSKLQFNKYLKVLFIFSDIVAFEYLIIARNYVLVLLLLVILAIVYKDRFKRPILYTVLLILLANTTIHVLGLVVVLSMLFLFESIKLCRNKSEKEYRISNKRLAIIILGIVLVIVTVVWIVLLTNNPNPEDKLVNISIPKTISEAYNLLAKGLYTYGYGNLGGIAQNVLFLEIAGLLMIISALILFIKQPKILFIYILSTGFLGIILTLAINSGTRHMYLYVLILMFCIWLKPYYKTDIKNEKIKSLQDISCTFLAICMTLLVIRGIDNIYLDYEHTFSDGRNLATFIKNNNYDEYTLVSYESAMVTSILPYLENKTLWCIEDQKEHTYIPWTKEFIDVIKGIYYSSEEIENIINNSFEDKSKILLIFDQKTKVSREYENKLMLLYSTTEETNRNDRYNVYVYK